MKILELRAEIWAERVDSSGTVGIVMEDGHVRGITQPAEALAEITELAGAQS